MEVRNIHPFVRGRRRRSGKQWRLLLLLLLVLTVGVRLSGMSKKTPVLKFGSYKEPMKVEDIADEDFVITPMIAGGAAVGCFLAGAMTGALLTGLTKSSPPPPPPPPPPPKHTRDGLSSLIFSPTTYPTPPPTPMPSSYMFSKASQKLPEKVEVITYRTPQYMIWILGALVLTILILIGIAITFQVLYHDVYMDRETAKLKLELAKQAMKRARSTSRAVSAPKISTTFDPKLAPLNSSPHADIKSKTYLNSTSLSSL
mmetsp:Transcript_15210/g.23023  ORF Transcript_15210/g.23023 Transcript_15210/m.23023 type:complete len:257 (+) Transcript_15210:122-892(+)